MFLYRSDPSISPVVCATEKSEVLGTLAPWLHAVERSLGPRLQVSGRLFNESSSHCVRIGFGPSRTAGNSNGAYVGQNLRVAARQLESTFTDQDE